MRDKDSPEGRKWYAEWMDAWAELCSAFPNARPEVGSMDTYADRLFDLRTPELLRAAVEQVICTHRFGGSLPTIADIREAAHRLTAPVRPSALEVWGATVRELQAARQEHRPPKLLPGVQPLVEALGGARGILDSDRPGVERSQFLKAWEFNEAEVERLMAATPAARSFVTAPGRLALPRPDRTERRHDDSPPLSPAEQRQFASAARTGAIIDGRFNTAAELALRVVPKQQDSDDADPA